jgi:peroxiredoxin
MVRKLLAAVGLIVLAGMLGHFVRPDTGPDSPSVSQPAQQVPETGEGIAVGKKAPDFTLKDLNGNPVRLSDLRGKPVFINFWATWCPPCRIEMPEMEQLYREHGAEFHMVAINLTATEKSATAVPAFLRQNGYTFPVILDPEEQASARYTVMAVPSSFFLDENGLIRAVWRGPMDRTTMLANLAKAERRGQ